MTNTHFKLFQAVRTKANNFDIEFENLFEYKTNIENVRIETWRTQMLNFQTYRWKICKSFFIFL